MIISTNPKMKIDTTLVITDPNQVLKCTLNLCTGTGKPIENKWVCPKCNQSYKVIVI